jgi:hypothetical protein
MGDELDLIGVLGRYDIVIFQRRYAAAGGCLPKIVKVEPTEN